MRYTTENFTTSMVQSLSEFCRQAGWNIYWYATQQTVAHAGATSLGTLTFVPAFPAEPTFISRLNGESSGKDDIIVPAVCIYPVALPIRVSTLGLGHQDSEWERPFVVEAVVETDEEQRILSDMIHEWLMATPNKAISAYDYAVPSTPVALDPMYVRDSTTVVLGNPAQWDAVKYVIRTEGEMYYFE